MASFPNLDRLRSHKGLTITKLAQESGVGRNLITSLEQGEQHLLVKVMLVFHAVNAHYGGSLASEKEVGESKP